MNLDQLAYMRAALHHETEARQLRLLCKLPEAVRHEQAAEIARKQAVESF